MNNTLKADYCLYSSGDPYGDTMAWLFAACDVLEDFGLVPEEFEFRQSPFGPETDVPEYQELLSTLNGGYCTLDDLLHFARVLFRHSQYLDHLGLSY